MKKLIFCFCLLSLFQCKDKNIIYSKENTINNKEWNKEKYYEFPIDIKESGNYTIFIELQHDNDYKYSNLYLFTELIHKNQDTITAMTKDTINYPISDFKGNWLSVKGKINLLYKENYFLQADKYLIRINQGMREDTLKGIENICLMVQKSNNEKEVK